MSRYLIGYDIGTSFIKATIIDADTNKQLATAQAPDKEMTIDAPKSGWAEQHPDNWWQQVITCTKKIIRETGIDTASISAIGISYQMHGLVMVDKNGSVLYPSIIWCDSRAVNTGNKAFSEIGEEKCLTNLLNSPGNFTASKLAWIKENQPEIYEKIDKIMLPGDYIAYKMSGEINTTPSGLSEGILWNFKEHSLAGMVLEHYGISESLIPTIVETFSEQGKVTQKAAEELGLKTGTPISYRAGDQPNNALSLNVFEPGEIAATAGTSGVVYGVNDQENYDQQSRVNTFVHVNYSKDKPRYGTLLCINGTGILNNWIKHNVMTLQDKTVDYDEMNNLASQVPIGCEGLSILPFGNGAERVLENKDIQSSINGINFNIHNRNHILRAVQEGIVFAFNYGLEIMKKMNINIETIRATHANMFLSPIFTEALSTISNGTIELLNSDGSQGAARGAGIGIGLYKNSDEAFSGLTKIKTIEPDLKLKDAYTDAYNNWKILLKRNLTYNT